MPSPAAAVVARYNEDLAWIARVIGASGASVTVYDKGASPPRSDWVRVPNVGREAETFARFICDNYQAWKHAGDSTAPAAVVFLQGNPFEHAPEQAVRAALALRSAPAAPVPLGRVHRCDHLGRPHHPGLLVGPAHALVFGDDEPIPRAWEFCAGAQYAVPPSAILARPLRFWQRLHALLESGAVDPWCAERLWPVIFGVRGSGTDDDAVPGATATSLAADLVNIFVPV